jgi:hypothetical protein
MWIGVGIESNYLKKIINFKFCKYLCSARESKGNQLINLIKYQYLYLKLSIKHSCILSKCVRLILLLILHMQQLA